jgi:nicotinamidase-related amidase
MAAPNRLVSIPARPAPLTIDLAQSAVLVIDMQNDFGSPGGMFDRAGIELSVSQKPQAVHRVHSSNAQRRAHPKPSSCKSHIGTSSRN